MAQRAVGVTDVATGAGVADFRTRERSVGGATVVEQYLLPLTDRVPSFKGMAASFLVPGIAVANTPLFTIFNVVGSGLAVVVRRLIVQHEFIAASTTMRTNSITRITTAPTGGTLHTPTALDTAGSHSASVEVRGAASADGTASAITSTVGTPLAWRDMLMKPATTTTDAGQTLFPDVHLSPLEDAQPIVLAAGEGIRVGQTESGNGNSRFLYCCVFEEYTL